MKMAEAAEWLNKGKIPDGMNGLEYRVQETRERFFAGDNLEIKNYTLEWAHGCISRMDFIDNRTKAK